MRNAAAACGRERPARSEDGPPAESVVILGANASGKSTLLQLMDGLLFPSAGQIRAFGRELTPAALAEPEFCWEFRRRVGLVFQDPEVQPFCPTVREEIAFGP